MLKKLLILLLLPGLLLPVTLQICVCAADAGLCCGEEVACCCSGIPAEDDSSATISADERCAGCVDIGTHDGGLRLTAPASTPLPEMSAPSVEPWALAALSMRTPVDSTSLPASALAPPPCIAAIPLRI